MLRSVNCLRRLKAWAKDVIVGNGPSPRAQQEGNFCKD